MRKLGELTKTCRTCNIDKSTADFYNATGKHTFRSACKPCYNTQVKQNLLMHPRSREQNRRNQAEFRKNNPEYNKLQLREFHAANPDYNKLSLRKWRKDHPDRNRLKKANERAVKYQAMPKWLTAEDRVELRLIYKNCPDGFHVDHIIPLRGKEVRGLHVPWNLQYLTPEENMKKNNKVST